MEETSRHLDYLDGWRGCAIAAVLAGHFFLEGVVASAGTFGVLLFFVLTGRLMADILFVQRAKLGRFYVRRMSRVVPALYVFVLTCFIAFGSASGGYPIGLKAALAAVTFTINYAMIYSHTVLLLDHLWSLCVEEHGYVVLSIVAVLAAGKIRLGGLVLGCAAACAFINSVVRHDVLNEPLLQVLWRSDVAIAPIAAAGSLFLLLRNRAISPYLCPAFLLAGTVLALSCRSALFGFVAATFCLAAAVVTVDQARPGFRRLLSSMPLTRLGKYSYSLYLWQQPFYKLHIYDAAPLWVLFPAAIGAGVVSFHLVEQPSRRAINSWFDRRQQARAERRSVVPVSGIVREAPLLAQP